MRAFGSVASFTTMKTVRAAAEKPSDPITPVSGLLACILVQVADRQNACPGAFRQLRKFGQDPSHIADLVGVFLAEVGGDRVNNDQRHTPNRVHLSLKPRQVAFKIEQATLRLDRSYGTRMKTSFRSAFSGHEPRHDRIRLTILIRQEDHLSLLGRSR